MSIALGCSACPRLWMELQTYYVAAMATIPPAAPATEWIKESELLDISSSP
jgi:hypothetical protein